jgi:transcription antitermination factor NusG
MPEVRLDAWIAVRNRPMMPEIPPTRWHALHVRSRHEKTVHSQLEAKQQDVFLPLYSARNKWGDRWRSVSLPLFPGYIFCRFDPADRYSVLATSGVIDIVRVGSEPAPIEAQEIEAVQLIVNSAVKAEPFPTLVKGQRVVLTDGPLTGLTGTLTQIRNTCRLVVSVELLCRSVSVEIDRDWVIPADAGREWFSKVPATVGL